MGCHLWTVTIVSKEEMDTLFDGGEGNEVPLGLTLTHECRICVRDDPCESVRWHAFWHEFVHVLTASAGLSKIDKNEDLVELLGMLIAQAQQTME